MSGDTIAALSSPPGGGARAVVRLSGPRAFDVARRLGPVPRRRGVRRLRLPGGLPADAWSMPGPASATGEDVVELHVPGSPPAVRALLDRLHAMGARPAEPGEFTRRAFLNGRLDLPRAEAVERLIRAGSDAELRAAGALLRGAFSARLRSIEERLLSLVADLEASIDFVDQDIDLLPAEAAAARAGELRAGLAALERETATAADAGAPMAVLVGPPNAGKSTLFNALTGRRALTSSAAGTTRDLLEGRVAGLRLFDAPGLGGRPATDADRAAQERARREIAHADLWIEVSDGDFAARGAARPAIRVRTKTDLSPAPPGVLGVSAKTGRGLAELKRRLAAWVRLGAPGPGARFLLSRRQADLLRRGRLGLERTIESLRGGRPLEITALEARDALDALGAVTGRQVDEAVLDRIFERFCLGK